VIAISQGKSPTERSERGDISIVSPDGWDGTPSWEQGVHSAAREAARPPFVAGQAGAEAEGRGETSIVSPDFAILLGQAGAEAEGRGEMSIVSPDLKRGNEYCVPRLPRLVPRLSCD